MGGCYSLQCEQAFLFSYLSYFVFQSYSLIFQVAKSLTNEEELQEVQKITA